VAPTPTNTKKRDRERDRDRIIEEKRCREKIFSVSVLITVCFNNSKRRKKERKKERKRWRGNKCIYQTKKSDPGFS